MVAKRRGEEPGTTILDAAEGRSSMKGKSASSSSMVMKKLPQRIASTQSAPLSRRAAQDEESADEGDANSESKENNPLLSPTPVLAQTPPRPTLAKRPLSDLPTPVEKDDDSVDAPLLSPSEQNIANNIHANLNVAALESSRKELRSGEEGICVRVPGRSLQDVDTNGLAAASFDSSSIDDNARPAKRVCSEEGKENLSEGQRFVSLPERHLSAFNDGTESGLLAPRKASAPGSLGPGGVKGKSRLGLRRL